MECPSAWIYVIVFHSLKCCLTHSCSPCTFSKIEVKSNGLMHCRSNILCLCFVLFFYWRGRRAPGHRPAQAAPPAMVQHFGPEQCPGLLGPPCQLSSRCVSPGPVRICGHTVREPPGLFIAKFSFLKGKNFKSAAWDRGYDFTVR